MAKKKKTAKTSTASLKQRQTRLKRVRERSEKERLKRAVSAWKDLTAPEKATLVSELVETRGEELQRAYREDVDEIFFSYKRKGTRKKRKGTRKKGGQKIRMEPCITFAVKRKWKKTTKRLEDREIPKYLLTYNGVRSSRTLCAVPTDVVVNPKSMGRSEAQLTPPKRIVVKSRNQVSSTEQGVMACLIQTPNGSRFALSCMHVFGMVESNGGVAATDATVSLLEEEDTPIAEPVWWGNFVSGPEFSLDASLATIFEFDRVLDALVFPPHKRVAEDEMDILLQGNYTIWSPDGPIPVTHAGKRGDFTRINYGPFLPEIHQSVVLSEFVSNGTKRGHSGSPVIDNAGEMFLGMHIGSIPNEGLAIMIPAYELIRPEFYDMPSNWKLRIL